jgi:peptidyl-prolyl cis-trans isomerase C
VPSSSASSAAQPIPPELAKKVLARVGERNITVAEYAATLERMDSFERVRYQSAERRRQLLDEMIDVELLAQEARRRGLDKLPKTQQRLREILRDELLREVRESVPKLETIPEPEVRRYYAEHGAEFEDAERRRVAHIVVQKKTQAEEILKRALAASPKEWGELVREFSLDKTETAASTALELSGDLGIVGPPGDERGGNLKVPEAVRAAVFKLEKLGDVLPELVEEGGRFHIVRLTGKTAAHRRSYEEAERAVRVRLVQKLVEEREAALERELGERYKVVIDEQALGKVEPPKNADSATRNP